MTCLFCYGDCGFKDCPDSRYYHDADDYYEDEWYEDDEPEYYYDPEEEAELERFIALDRLYADVLTEQPYTMERGADGVGYHPLPF